MGDVTFQRERLSDIRSEIAPLLEAHWHEIAHYDDIPLDPDWDAYDQSEDLGLVRCFTVRHDGLLAGYAVFVVRTNPHYRMSKQANQDVLFLIPEMRRSSTGARLIAWCDDQLRSEGCQVVIQHIKAKHNFGPLLERQGYELVDLIYAKRLDKTA